MTIRQRRIEKGWSQLQLAEFAGVSLRTIQRIEKGCTPTIETLKSLAAVFEVNFNELSKDSAYGVNEAALSDDELHELEHIRGVQRFLRDLVFFLIMLPIMLLLNTIETFNGDWLLWGLVLWGGYLAWHAFEVFDARDFFGQGWEKRMLEKRLGRKID